MKIKSLIVAITITCGLTMVPSLAFADDTLPPPASTTHDTSPQTQNDSLSLIESTALPLINFHETSSDNSFNTLGIHGLTASPLGDPTLTTFSFRPVAVPDIPFVIPNYPQTNKKTGCRQAKIGQYAFNIAYKTMICTPVTLAAGTAYTPIVGSVIGWGCGKIGKALEHVIPFDNVCS